MTFLKTSRKSVVKYNKDDEDGVVDGESNEKFVESIFHLACRKNKYWENIPNESKGSNKRLEN